MSASATVSAPAIWRLRPWAWLALGAVAFAVVFTFHDGIGELIHTWGAAEEYSYGYLIPFLALFLGWQRKDEIERADFDGSWIGALMVLFGIALFVLGELSTIYLMVQYSLVVVIAGLLLAFTGRRGVALFTVPVAMLLFMIPLPNFLLAGLSTQLQLVSTTLGVWFIKLFGISVYAEGNVIDLGTMKLQVVEACSGLRYLFPLMALGFIAACFYRAARWRRVVVFLSSVPITIVMNSVRIGIIGVTAEYWGRAAAEGFLHDFEGWGLFMVCAALLIGVIGLLNRFDRRGLQFRDVFGFALPAATPADVQVRYRTVPAAFVAAALAVAIGAVLAVALPQRVEVTPARLTFDRFPTTLGEWTGRPGRIERAYLDVLKLDDYLMADFLDPHRGSATNLYIAYYASQRKGESAHSPRTCIPGGGWGIESLTQRSIDGAQSSDAPLRINRVVIERGPTRQLVYYWFQQRGREITNEYLVKWYLFWDAVTRSRTDGALVRITAETRPGESIDVVDQRLAAFTRAIRPMLDDFIPR